MFNEQALQIAERIRGLRLILDIPVSEMAEVCGMTEEDYIAFPDMELCQGGAPTTHDSFITVQNILELTSPKLLQVRNQSSHFSPLSEKVRGFP